MRFIRDAIRPATRFPFELLESGQTVLYIGTGRYLGSPDLSDPGAASGISWQQTLWAFKDQDSDYGNLRTNGNLVRQVLTMLNPTDRGITARLITTAITVLPPRQLFWAV